MATCEDSLKFLQTVGDAFYFEDSGSASPETENLCSDAFRVTPNKQSCCIQSKDHKCLVLKTSGNFEFEDRPKYQLELADCRFSIQFYKNSMPDKPKAVMLYVCNDDGKKMMITCKDKRDICPKPMDPEQMKDINKFSHEALFHPKMISTNTYMFESTVYAGHFLAFEPADGPVGLHKLILRCTHDEVDESMHLQLTNNGQQ